MRRKMLIVAGVFLVALLGAGAVLWTQREALQAWYALRGLGKADEADREPWVSRVVALGDCCVEPLFDSLAGPEDRPRANALAALAALGEHWGSADPRTADLAGRLARNFAPLPPTMQASLLTNLSGWFKEGSSAAGLVPAASRLLTESAAVADADVQAAALELVAVLVQQPEGQSALPAAREMAGAGLGSSSAKVRLRAIRLALQPGIDQLERVVGLLRDPSAEVRRSAILALGPADQIVREDGLLPGLHDSDAEVRRLTEAALKGRGLRPEQLELGRLLTHPQATVRIQVLDRVVEVLNNRGADLDIDPGVWLRRLSHDNSPGVRAAALRMMSQQSVIDLNDRIDQMARSDPSPSVSQMAQFYLSRKRSARTPTER